MTQKQEDQAGASLDDLFEEATIAQAMKNQKQPRKADPSLRDALDAAAKKMRDLYQLPENWERKRGIALIDKQSGSLVGNFFEYVHRSMPQTRKLIREHTPIAIDATEVCEGYLGAELEFRLRGNTWEAEHLCEADLLLDELGVECPSVPVRVCTRLGAIVRVELQKDWQLASTSGGTLLHLPAGTDVWLALGTDSKRNVRKAAGL